VTKLTISQALQQGVDAHKTGQVQEAHRLYAAILKAQPKHPDANHNMGLLFVGDGKIEVALPFFRIALEANPNIAQFWYSHIVALIKLERLLDAKILLDQAKNKGIKGGDFDQLEQKINDTNKALAVKSGNADTHNNMGVTLQDQGNLEKAIEAYRKAIAIKPDYAGAYYNMANALKEQGNLEEAVVSYGKALSFKPDHADAHNNLGNVLKEQGNLEEAVVSYGKALSFKPDYVMAYYNMGHAFQDQGNLEKAIEAFRKAIVIKPDYAEAHNNMGRTLQDQGNLEGAIVSYCKALSLKPDYVMAYYNMGHALQEQGNLEKAIEAYSKVIAIKPDYTDAHYNMANALREQGNLEKAIEAIGKALAIRPDYESLVAQKLHWQAHICDWNSIAKDLKRVPELGITKKHVPPFALLSLEDSLDRHLTRSKIYAKAKYSQKVLLPKDKPSKRPKRIRIGYFSTDFKEHPVAYLIAKVLEQHNRDQFEVFGYSIYGSSSCIMRQRLKKSFDSFTDVQSMSDRDIALQARQDKIDIAVDLNGHTRYARTGIFAYRAAPIQINYLGYPGSMGMEFIDYIVADQHLIPSGSQKHFSEKQIYLPNTYMPTDDSRELSQKPMNRNDMGLPDDAFVFCCFNNNYKISPNEFDIWMRLLTKVEKSVLWLRKSNQISKINMKNEAQKRKVDPSRIVFADKLPMDEHLARHKLADLFIDTFAFNAHTTATEALWAGLPVVTKIGLGFAARVAGSLLNAVGLPELVTETERDYEALILELATNPTKLAKIKEKLATNRLTQPLFNTELYIKHLENGYQQAYKSYFEGNLPQAIIVPK